MKTKKKSTIDGAKQKKEIIPSENFQPVVDIFSKTKNVTLTKMFGSIGIKVNNKVFALEVKGSLVVKLPKQDVDEMVKEGMGKYFDPGHGKPMKEWIVVPSSKKLEWKALAKKAKDFVDSL